MCTNSTKALLLTTYFKWVNLFPEIREQLLAVFQKYSLVLDAELQQRACEYLAIANLPDEELLQVVVDEMPPFPERESALLSRLIKRSGDTHDKRTWYVGGKEVNQGQDAARYQGFGRRKGRDAATHEALAQPRETPATPGTIADDLMGLDLSHPSSADTPTVAESPQPPVSPNGTSNGSEAAAAVTTAAVPSTTKAPAATTPTPRRTVTHGADKWLSRLVYNSEGVLWEDAQFQVGVKCEFHGHLGRIAVYFGNKMPVALESFTVMVDADTSDALKVTMPKIPTPHISALSQVQQLVHVECRDSFADPPLLHISYLAGSLQTLTLRLPVWISKFIEPVKLEAGPFFERWKQIGGAPREAQKVFPIVVDAQGLVDVGKNRRVVGGTRLGVLDGIDPNPNNIVAAGVLHMSNGGKVGCLLRLEPNANAKVSYPFRASEPTHPGETLCTVILADISSYAAVSPDDPHDQRSRLAGAAGHHLALSLFIRQVVCNFRSLQQHCYQLMRTGRTPVVWKVLVCIPFVRESTRSVSAESLSATISRR